MAAVVTQVPGTQTAAQTPPRRRGLARRAARLCWIWPALAALGLGLWEVTQPVLWRDELSGWSIAARGIPEILRTGWKTNGAQVPYYLALHCWMAAFGQSVLSMRLLSVLAMAGAAAFVALAARELAGPRAAVTAGLVFALVPSVSRFAQEVRFYALTLLFAALATWLLARALDRPSRRLWAGYAASMAVVGCLDLVAMTMLAGHGSWVALRWWWDRDRRPVTGFALAAAGSVAVCLPVAILGTRQARSQVGWIAKPDFTPAALGHFGSNLFYSGPVAVAVLVLAAVAWALRPRVAQYLTAAALVPLVAVCVLSEGKVSYFYPRYVLFTLIALSICAGVAAASLGRRMAVAALLGLALLGFHDQAMIRQPDAHEWAAYPSGVVWNFLEYKQAARLVGFNARPGDGVVYPDGPGNRWLQVNQGVGYYLGQYLPRGVPAPHEELISRTAAQANSLYPTRCGHPDQCVGDAPRIWVVGTWGPYPLGSFTPAEVRTLKHGYRMSHVWHIGQLPIGLMIRR